MSLPKQYPKWPKKKKRVWDRNDVQFLMEFKYRDPRRQEEFEDNMRARRPMQFTEEESRDLLREVQNRGLLDVGRNGASNNVSAEISRLFVRFVGRQIYQTILMIQDGNFRRIHKNVQEDFRKLYAPRIPIPPPPPPTTGSDSLTPGSAPIFPVMVPPPIEEEIEKKEKELEMNSMKLRHAREMRKIYEEKMEHYEENQKEIEEELDRLTGEKRRRRYDDDEDENPTPKKKKKT